MIACQSTTDLAQDGIPLPLVFIASKFAHFMKIVTLSTSIDRRCFKELFERNSGLRE